MYVLCICTYFVVAEFRRCVGFVFFEGGHPPPLSYEVRSLRSTIFPFY